jgi:hypothetical protein
MSGLTREEFEATWARLDVEAHRNKFSHQALLRLTELYRDLDADDRDSVAAVLREWVLTASSRQRFDALALIDGFVIRSAAPELRVALERLDGATGPSVPSDRAKLERIIARIGEPS